MTVYNIDCILGMRFVLADNSVDAIVTDPPYELGFMGRAWDGSGIAFNPEVWREALRVLKPGGHLLAFGGSRTYHRMACAIEDAGFEIRDQIMWVYGSGMPKAKGQLKPAHEPICVARKPFKGSALANVAAHGTGALFTDACRVSTDDDLNGGAYANVKNKVGGIYGKLDYPCGEFSQPTGRWPANLVHDGSDEVIAAFPNASGQQGALTGNEPSARAGAADQVAYGAMSRRHASEPRREDDKSAARFFYCAKASKADRGQGNTHPTVKPTALMRYLVRLVTPPGGTVADLFTGSGTTAVAAKLEGFEFVGFELSPEYAAIATARVEAA